MDIPKYALKEVMPFDKFGTSSAISGRACFKSYGGENTKIDVLMDEFPDILRFTDLLWVSVVVYGALNDIMN